MLVASAKLSDRRLKRIIFCYAEGKTPGEAIEITGVSHVTVRRMYRQIRERLIAVGLYEPRIAPDAPSWWLEQQEVRHAALMRQAIRPHRGVKAENVAVYYAEARFQRDSVLAPGQLYRLILKAIADLGPLNQEPKIAWPGSYLAEQVRVSMAQARTRLRQSDSDPKAKEFFVSLADAFDPTSHG